MTTLTAFNHFTSSLKEQDQLMPVLFVGHGSPTNALEDNEFTIRWKQMAKQIPVPKAVLIVSAHWLTRGTHITAMEKPKTIHDFGGFSRELNEARYPAPGNPALAKETASLIKSTNVGLDHDWGLDHGAWSVVMQMYPEANIPMLQLSMDYYKPAQYHYDLAKELAALRKKGVLILASGNMVHNLGMLAIRDFSEINNEYGYDWALEMNEIFKSKITNGDHQALINYEKLSKSAKLAVPSPDHYYPLLYALALQGKNEGSSFFNDKAVAGSLTMTSVKIG
ncbi:4,5-DOPA-extradiol-dioxygenase [Adhaeribacter soli]|uniref:4,5-DOPA dioxygenase extradiol n=1 Tax=Adhaeribacter soli TaxID=2607655 RepID=A0A5N1IJZ8_9BACT|nr:4,5-DOPA dioxygenase extradiol [Adhaeribacter soli]KAA9326073.1 4,5-DOPA dioxygenase extradiol [Adhaeribacter soli]